MNVENRETPVHNVTRHGLYDPHSLTRLANTTEHSLGKPTKHTVSGNKPIAGDPDTNSDTTNRVASVRESPGKDTLATPKP